VGNDHDLRENRTVLTDDERREPIREAEQMPAAQGDQISTVYHYSEDGTIKRFAPHVPPTNPSHPPAVWAVDADHAPMYWFPRNCPRISVWASTDAQQEVLTAIFHTESSRICAAESSWLTRVRDAGIYRYSFDSASFAPWTEADGQYISGETEYPETVELLDDLLALHAEAEVELRFTARLGVLMDHMLASGLPFSFVRIRDARR
jgi:hypothetical protein